MLTCNVLQTNVVLWCVFKPARVNCVRLLPRSPRAILTDNGCARDNGSDRIYVDLFI